MKSFGDEKTRLRGNDLSDDALWVYENTDPCNIYEYEDGWEVDIAGDTKFCISIEEVSDFLEWHKGDE